MQALENFRSGLEELRGLKAFGEAAMSVRSIGIAGRLVGKQGDSGKVWVESEVKKLSQAKIIDLNRLQVSVFVSVCFYWENLLREMISEVVAELAGTGRKVRDERDACRTAVILLGQVVGSRDRNHLAATYNLEAMVKSMSSLLVDDEIIDIHPAAYSFFISSGDSDAVDKVLKRLRVNTATLWERVGEDSEVMRVRTLPVGKVRNNGKEVRDFLDRYIRERNEIVHGAAVHRIITSQTVDEILEFFGAISAALCGLVRSDLKLRVV